jgi:hypothetical protein
MVLSIIQKEEERMSQNYDREYNEESEPAAGWAAQTRALEPPHSRKEIYAPEREYPQDYPLAHRQNLAARGFAQMFGLHPAMAFLTIVVDTMVFSGDIISAGLLLPVAFGAAAVLGVITYLAQRKHYGDENDSAVVKALIVALLTAIPSPLPYALFIPAGLVGLFRRKR